MLATLSLSALSFKPKYVFEPVGKTHTRHRIFFCVIDSVRRIFTFLLSVWVAEGCWWHCRAGSMRRWYKYGSKLLLTNDFQLDLNPGAASPPSVLTIKRWLLLCKTPTILSFFLLVVQNYRSFICSIGKTNQLLTSCLFLLNFLSLKHSLKKTGQSFVLYIIYVLCRIYYIIKTFSFLKIQRSELESFPSCVVSL